MSNLLDNSFEVYIGFPKAHVIDIFGRNELLQDVSCTTQHFEKIHVHVLKLTLVIKTTFRISKDSWVFSLIHKLFTENTLSVGALIPGRLRRNPTNFNMFEYGASLVLQYEIISIQHPSGDVLADLHSASFSGLMYCFNTYKFIIQDIIINVK
jgi:hypothetical protein